MLSMAEQQIPSSEQTNTEQERILALTQELTDMAAALTASGESSIVALSQEDYRRPLNPLRSIDHYHIQRLADEETQTPTFIVTATRTDLETGSDQITLTPGQPARIVEDKYTSRARSGFAAEATLGEAVKHIRNGRPLISGKEVLVDGRVYKKRGLGALARLAFSDKSSRVWE